LEFSALKYVFSTFGPAGLAVLLRRRSAVVAWLVCAGGGRKIIRVEVSLDAGESWELAELTHPEQPTEYGKYWCWALWELQVDVMHLFTTKELMVRAWDSSMNTQPDKITWNVMVSSHAPSAHQIGTKRGMHLRSPCPLWALGSSGRPC
jgi:hypothetical protein